MEDLKKWIKSYPDFPSKGILFRDISPLLAEPKALSLLKDRFVETIKPLNADYVAGIDARGFCLYFSSRKLGSRCINDKKA